MTVAAPNPKRLAPYDPRRALGRLSIAVVVGVLASEVLSTRFSVTVQLLGALDAGGLAMLAIAWSAITGADAARTRARAGAEDPGRRTVYVITVFMSVVTLVVATLVSRHVRAVAREGETLLLAFMCLLAVALSWGLTHTSFTFRYAHLYYREDDEGVGGITFAGDEPPSYFDFAYFAFTLGMCFQVSDTTVTSCQIRRTVLAHALLSFAYNTVIMAFVLSLVFAVV